jgi:hypothetical protein
MCEMSTEQIKLYESQIDELRLEIARGLTLLADDTYDGSKHLLLERLLILEKRLERRVDYLERRRQFMNKLLEMGVYAMYEKKD